MAVPCPQEQYPVFLRGVKGEIRERREKLIVRRKRIEDRCNLVIRDEEKTGRWTYRLCGPLEWVT